MATEKKPFLLRVNVELLQAYQKWADDELRSLNGQLDYILQKALRDAGRGAPVSKNQNAAKVEKKKTS